MFRGSLFALSLNKRKKLLITKTYNLLYEEKRHSPGRHDGCAERRSGSLSGGRQQPEGHSGQASCFGSKHVKTPNIDRLAATGTTFTQCYAGSGISSPSRCALMTGKNTGNTTIRDNTCTAGGIKGIKISPKGDTTYIRRANLLPTDTTLATVVGAAGYRTCLVNKWHLDTI